MHASPLAPALLAPGRSVGDYVLLSELGRGGFGVVYEAEHTQEHSRVALKTLQANLSSPQGQRALTRFLLEVRAVRQIRHPNVVRYIDGGQLTADDGSVLAFYAMELLPGETLDQIVKRDGPMHPVDAASVIRQSAVGLYTAHIQGIVHRDIKPGNIMLAPNGRAVVTDFGVCKILEIHNVTTAGQVVGTARYLSPEQFAGAQVDARSDVFALGALLFFLLTGEHLRVAKDLVILSRSVLTGGDQKRVREARGLPSAFRKVLLRTTAQDPSERFTDALALAHALEEACLSREIRHLPPPPSRVRTPEHGRTDPDHTLVEPPVAPDVSATQPLPPVDAAPRRTVIDEDDTLPEPSAVSALPGTTPPPAAAAAQGWQDGPPYARHPDSWQRRWLVLGAVLTGSVALALSWWLAHVLD